jgi:hypothetical protein
MNRSFRRAANLFTHSSSLLETIKIINKAYFPHQHYSQRLYSSVVRRNVGKSLFSSRSSIQRDDTTLAMLSMFTKREFSLLASFSKLWGKQLTIDDMRKLESIANLRPGDAAAQTPYLAALVEYVFLLFLRLYEIHVH